MGSQYIVPHPALGLRESFFDPASDAPDREAAMATAVTFAWEKAQDGLRAILEFGALLCRVEEWLKARPASERLGRNAAVSLKGWLSEHCPQVNYDTARGYKAAALGLREAAKLAADRPLLPLMGEKPLSDAEEEAARQRVMGVIASSSLRLLKEAGRALPAKTGGPRLGAGRHSKAEEAAALAREAAAIAADPEIADAQMGALLEPLRVWAEERDGLVAVTDKALGLLVATLRDIADIAGQIQAERRAQRRAGR